MQGHLLVQLSSEPQFLPYHSACFHSSYGPPASLHYFSGSLGSLFLQPLWLESGYSSGNYRFFLWYKNLIISTFCNLDVYFPMKYVYEVVLDSLIRINMHLGHLWSGLRNHFSALGCVSLGPLSTCSSFTDVIHSTWVSGPARFTLSLVPNEITSSSQSVSPISFPPHGHFIIFLTQRSQTARLGISWIYIL